MIPNPLFSRDIVVRTSYKLVFVEEKTRLYYRAGNEWRRAPLPRRPYSVDDYASLVFYGVYNLYFSVQFFEKEETSYILIDVDIQDPRVYGAVMEAVAGLLGVDVREAYERVPKYLTAKGFNIILRTRRPLGRDKIRYYLSVYLGKQRVLGGRSLKSYVDYSVADARLIRVPFSPVKYGDYRRVVPIPGDSLARAVRWQYSIVSSPREVDRVYEEWVYLPREVEEAIEEVEVPEAGTAPWRTPPRRAVGPPPCMVYLLEKAMAFSPEPPPRDGRPHLTHYQRLFLAVLFKRMFKTALWRSMGETEPAYDMIHWALRYMDDYKPRETDRRYRGADPELQFSCRRLLEEGVCPYRDRRDQRYCPYYNKLWLYYTLAGVKD